MRRAPSSNALVCLLALLAAVGCGRPPANSAPPAPPSILRCDEVTAGLPPGAIEIVVVDPADSAHLFALGHYQACATSADGLVFESRDSGASWKRVRFCAGVADVISIEFSRADPRCLWADNGRGEVAHSVDGGLTWTPVRFPPGVEPRPLVADLGDARTLHANVEQGLWRSADSGVKWVQVASFPSSDAAWRLRVADPFDHRSFYGWRGDFSAKDLGRTTDAGATWKVCAPLPTDPSIMNLLPDVTRRGGLFVHSRDGLHRSTDGGLSWSSVAPMPMSSTAYWGEHGLVQAPGGELYVLWEGDRIFRSSDRASSWELVFAGPAEERAQPGIRALALGRSAPRVLYAATFWNGVLRSGDGGRTWKPINQGLTGSHISSLVEDPHDRNVLYCTTMPGGLHRSRDGGRSWSPVKAPAGRLVMAMALDRRNPGLLYLATDEGFLKSGDGGKTWTMRNRGLGDRPLLVRLAVDPDDPRGLFAQGIGGTVFVSRDAGESWSPVEPPVSTPDVQRQLAPSSERVVLFESRKGAGSVSLDGGRTWTPVSGPGAPRSVSCMRISSREPSVFYVGTGSGCLFRSDDSGVSWVALGRTSQPGSAGAQLGDTAGGLLANDAVNCIIEDPLDENTLYAATQSGLFVSRDGGRTLVRQETNPRLKSVNSIVLSRDEGRVLTLGTSGGMFQTRLPAPGSLPPGGPR